MTLVREVIPALKAAGFVGIWNTNAVAGRTILDDGAAELLAGNVSLAGQPIPLEAALGATHPDDRAWLFERVRRVRQTGGPFSAEFRVINSAGDVRWVLNRGVLKHDSTGTMHGLGAYIDTTDSHRPPFVSAASLHGGMDDPLEAAADHCLRAHAELKTVGDTYLRLRAEMLLTGIGQALARRGN
ncbi:PAS domain-containing protein [Methylobacterium flocculans]|uniref:PAS domain-containing protein n=1 Tax=Methylobacterium flocculans TaxID=2984843 RepID=UPI0021F373A6|nr:PAS domain-containing protein [Methylobacterium sp. FF17]